MWPLITGPSVRCLRTAFRARFVLLARPLSISRFDVRDPQTREYLKTLKTLLAMNDMSPFGKISGANIQRLRATGELYETIEKISEEMMSLEQLRKAVSVNMTVEMLETKEQDMVDIATKDIAKCHEKITQISAEIYTNLVPIELVDTQEVLLELNAGVGGQEAMLFNQDLMTMYLKFSQLTMGWNVEVTEASLSETGKRFLL
ncbi:uncharacterized protein LOC111243652 [Varroa destructor]|uniref:Peptide chain release factor domain-containing protein n=2 Tax=Varroa TaxID=62624 RepID=A0A7M7J2G6_VARDE|nr:uncharacterized protein LOC111243652 [Varroa destructor]